VGIGNKGNDVTRELSNKQRKHVKRLNEAGKPTQWKKGQSGNPSGKGKAAYDIIKAARRASPEAFKTIVKIAKDEKAAPSLRLRASEFIIERAFGKSVNPLHLELGGKVDHKSDHLVALVAVNREVAEHQRLGKSNGVEVVDHDAGTHTVPRTADGTDEQPD
jgi:hypothetical protein